MPASRSLIMGSSVAGSGRRRTVLSLPGNSPNIVVVIHGMKDLNMAFRDAASDFILFFYSFTMQEAKNIL